jgi:hypothetical protein
MKKDVMRKWVAALRSGDYMQGFGRLRQVDAVGGGSPVLCALGVLCQVHKNETRSATWRYQPLSDCWAYGRAGIRADDRDVSSDRLPDCVADWAGVQSANAQIPATGTTVSGMNDDGLSFVDIADVIERQWESL